jgi:NADPH:quinone reductase-like Zn-dependent oxidoreductase
MREAAALPLIFITAWEGLVDRAGVHSGQKVLVHGGAGGVGHIAVQIARAFGADVFATGSAASQAYIRRLGAVPIDYRAMTIENYVAKYGEIMREATTLVEAGQVVPRVDPRHFSVSSVGDADRAIEANDADGKIVVDIGE